MKILSNKQKEYFEFVKEWSNIKFTGDPNKYNDVCEYVTQHKVIAYDNYYLLTGGNSSYI